MDVACVKKGWLIYAHFASEPRTIKGGWKLIAAKVFSMGKKVNGWQPFSVLDQYSGTGYLYQESLGGNDIV